MQSDGEKSPKRRGIPDLDKRIRRIENYDNSFQKQVINLEELAGKELWDNYQRAYDSILLTIESAQKIMNEIKQKIFGVTNSLAYKIPDQYGKELCGINYFSILSLLNRIAAVFFCNKTFADESFKRFIEEEFFHLRIRG